jgi:YVTN family beta-propeller protein
MKAGRLLPAFRSAFPILFALALVSAVTAGIPGFVNFETAPVHPIALGPDGRTLAVCNLPASRLELFDVSSGVPVPAGSVGVGLDPVTVRFASSNELWVVNHISSSISIIDLAARTVVATLGTPAGPGDLVFAGNPRRAWVSCSRTNAVFIIDPATRAGITSIAIDGERPRAMATSPDGSKVYVAIFESGNGTTILGRKLTALFSAPAPGPIDAATGPYAGADPPPNFGSIFSPPINPDTASRIPPRVSHIVRKTAEGRWVDDNNADWTEWVSGTNAALSGRIQGWDLPDRDLAIIDTVTLEVSYAQRLMNLCMAVGVNPISGQIALVGTDGTNEKRFEPLLNGVFLRVNLALVDPLTRSSRIRDLNPHLDYVTRTLPEAQRSLGLGDPRGIEWSSDGTRAYITGMGSRNLIIVDAVGDRVTQPIELGEGPTGIAIDEARARLYVWNRFSATISVVDTGAGVVVTNVPHFDPTPDIVRKGRRHLYDTRKNSGTGIASCASCHPDARMDRLAWDLGDPSGVLLTNRIGFANVIFHPMKGPMVTQTLQDIISPTNFNGQAITQQALHWRGDRRNIEEFNPTFTALLARDTQLSSNEMAEFKQTLASIHFPPNPLRTFSNSLPASVPLPGHVGRLTNNVGAPLPSGNPQLGLQRYVGNCRVCHDFNSGRMGVTNIGNIPRNGTEGFLVFSQLRSLPDKLGADFSSTNGRSGFGLMHDGRVDTLSRFMLDGFATLSTTDQLVADMVAFLLCFSGSDLFPNPSKPSQDVPAATGQQVTFASSAPPPQLTAMFDLVIRTNSRLELVLRGKKSGQMRGWLLRRPTQEFQSDRHDETAATMGEVIATAAPGNEFTATLVPEGSGVRFALDGDGDGYFDTSEAEAGFNAADPLSHPDWIVNISRSGSQVGLSWLSTPGTRYILEFSGVLSVATHDWNALGAPLLASTNITTYTDSPPAQASQRFYRVRKEP